MRRLGIIIAALAFGAVGLVASFDRSADAQTTFVVDTTSSDEALTACTAAPADCSLEGAVMAANALAGADVITFDIPADQCPDGVCRIEIDEIFLDITDALTIDGTTQPRHDGPQANVCATDTAPSHMRVEVVATDPTLFAGIYVNHATGSSTVRGLAVGVDGYDFATLVNFQQGSGHHVACNHLGLDADGTAQLGLHDAIEAVYFAESVTGATVGTNGDGVDDLAERNVIGYAAAATEVLGDNVVFAGNWVGLGTDGTSSFPSALGVEIQLTASNVLVGSNQDGTSDDLERNYFTNSSLYGVWAKPSESVDATDWRVVGNTFGATPAGEIAGVTQAVDITGLASANTGFEIRDNIFFVGTFPVAITGTQVGSSAVITDNWFGTLGATIGGAGTDYGAYLQGSGTYTVADNWFHNVDRAVVLTGAATLTGSTNNCLAGNEGSFTTVDNQTGIAVTFEDNWWGDASGPSGAGPGTGLTVSADVDFDPWRTTKPAVCNNPPTTEDNEISVTEFEVVPNELGAVARFDADGDEITFSIVSGNGGGQFAIDPVSGILSQLQWLDYETQSLHVLVIEVSDGSASAFATWTVNVVDGFETPSTATFTDIPMDHQFWREIEYMVWANITLGCNADGTLYCPGDSVSRAQMGSFLARALDLDPVPGDRFDDVSGVHEANINAIAEAGITLGCDTTGTLYCPDDLITRAQMGSFLARAFALAPVPGDRFDDVDGVHEANINAIAEAGITLGCDTTGTLYCPDDLVTRAQMAAFVVRGLTGGAD